VPYNLMFPSRLVFVCAVVLLSTSSARAQSGREVNVFPIAGGDSDVGIGIGGVGDWAALAPGKPAFRWRLEAAAFVTFKTRDGDVVMPFQDGYLQLIVPRFGLAQRFGLDARLSFTEEQTLKYTGIGNASPPLAPGLPLSVAEHARLHPTASVEVRAYLVDHLYLLLGAAYTENRLWVDGDTILAQQQSMGPPEVRRLLGSFDPHGVALLTAEVQLDTRDDPIVTRTGQFHTLRFRASPALGAHLPYDYQRATLTLRAYRTPVPRWLTIAGRLVGDVLLGDPPFYELARFDETPALGGSKAVRGVPAQRYYGKVKVFGNLEAIGELLPFTVKDKPFILGAAVFLDAGRTWTELGQSNPQLDGTGLGLKYGVGAGLRLQQGRTMLLRFDVAWSPDADPIGAYFSAGEIF
jgi:hypothetical protein